MKKLIVTLTLLSALVTAVFGQAGSVDVHMADAMLSVRGLSDYSKWFLNRNGRIAPKYGRGISEDVINKFAAIEGNTSIIDTPAEIALLSYSAGVIDIRPPQAVEMLPKNRESDLKVGALLYQNLQVATATRASNASVYATLLNEFCAENGISKADVKNYFDRNIGALVSAEVDEGFNQVSFMVDVNSQTSYNCTLTRSTNNQYVLSYESYFGTNTKSKKELSAASLEALASAMRNSGDFVPAAIDAVRAQAALIPAVTLGAAMPDIKSILTTFYTRHDAASYNAVKEMYALFARKRAESGLQIWENVRVSCGATLASINNDLAQRIFADANNVRNITTLTTEQQQRLVPVNVR